MDTTQTICALLDEWQIPATTINCGQCDTFADALIRKMGYGQIRYSDEFEDLDTYNFHVWVVVFDLSFRYGIKHFDAECPIGVEHYLDLPFFKRQRGTMRETYIDHAVEAAEKLSRAALIEAARAGIELGTCDEDA